MIHSFDIFDTILTRLVSPPEAVFSLLAERVKKETRIDTNFENFLLQRREAERRARRHRSSGEVTLTDIYTELAFALSLTAKESEALLRCELDLEQELLVSIPGASELVSSARKDQPGVIYISDMYLPSTFLIEQLQKHGFWDYRDRLYLSCERGISKGNGALFKEVEHELKSSGQNFHHTGNHPRSDGTAAALRGWKTSVLTRNNVNRFETLLEEHSGETSGVTAFFAGASRLARLETSGPERDQIIAEVAAGVIAPALTSFLLWLFQEARKQKIDRLYFVSRDGQILHEMAKRLASKTGYTPELRYLYGSRQAWHTANVRNIDGFFEEFVLEAPDGLSLNMVFERLGLDLHDFHEEIERCGLSHVGSDDPLTSVERATLKALSNEPAFTSRLSEQTRQNRDRLLAYLRQENWEQANKSALVDIGWTGKSLRSFYEVLEEAGLPRPPAFFFGLLKSRTGESGPRPRTFLFDAETKLGPIATKEELHYYPIFIENFCAGDHGGVRGFVNENGRMNPDLRSAENRAVLDWGLPVLRKTVYSFCERLLLPADVLNRQLALAPVSAKLLRSFYETPTPVEARVWGAFPAETDPNGAFRHTWAAPYLWRDVAYALRRGYMPHTSTTWRPACTAATPLFRKRIIHVTLALRGRASKWLSRLRWTRTAPKETAVPIVTSQSRNLTADTAEMPR